MQVSRIILAAVFGASALAAQAPAPETIGFPHPADEQTPASAQAPQSAPRPKAFEYSDGYLKRQKIHKYASIATLPLFVSEVIVGQKLYNGTAGSNLRGVHSALAGGIAGLFGVNSFTGVWNLMEARKDPNHKTKRTIHGILMLGADAGFVATAALAPEGDHEGRVGTPNNSRRSTHRAVALTSMGVAAASYLYMLIAR